MDESWFGRKNTFNTPSEDNRTWTTNQNKIEFPAEKSWSDYIELNRLEITCGEAPYLVSRYDTVSGDPIPIHQRIGLLDRKLRVVNENTYNAFQWEMYTKKAFQCIYGYDFQGDNVLLARKNLLMTFLDNYIYYRDATRMISPQPSLELLKDMTSIISWNIWQMDGLHGTVPFRTITEEVPAKQLSLFQVAVAAKKTKPWPCRIMDWKANRPIEFNSLLKKEK